MAHPAIWVVHSTLQFVNIYEQINQICEAQAVIVYTMMANDALMTPSSPSSPLPAIVSNPHQAFPDQPRLQCVKFLRMHLEHGGVEKTGYDVLYHLIQMASAIGWELHVMIQSDIVRQGAMECFGRYLNCILQGCDVFKKNMAMAVENASSTASTLPRLGNLVREDLERRLRLWKSMIKALHKPTGNDRRLFRLIFLHYDSVAHQRLLHLHRRKPNYGLNQLVTRPIEVSHALQELYKLAHQADSLVIALTEELRKAQRSQPNDGLIVGKAPNVNRDEPSSLSSEVLTAAVYGPPKTEAVTILYPMLSKSFSAAEEALARHGHARAATFPEADYTTNMSNAEIAQPRPTYLNPRTGSRRRNVNIPRIFTGSFSQLESDIRRLQLDKVKTPEDQTTLCKDHVKVRDFGASPHISPCPTPTIQLQRREALVSKDTEIQDRLIRGEVVSTRRPSTKGRAQTIDDPMGGLEAWLKQDSPRSNRSKWPRTPTDAVHRGNARHREKTL